MPERPGRGRPAILAALAAAWVGIHLLALGVGAVDLPPSRVAALLLDAAGRIWSGPDALGAWLGEAPERRVLLEIRLPRVLVASLVGAALAGSGTAFQGMFRNPMADPYVLGVSSGASLGAVLALYLAGRGVVGLGTVPGFAFATALGAVALVYLLARSDGRLPVGALLLAGIAVASFLSALVGLVVYLSGERLRPMIFWLLGSLASAGWRDVGVLLPYLAAGFAVLWRHGRALNALLLGEEAAHYLGVDAERVKRRVVASGALLAAAAVSVGGVIGFVGLMVPQGVRLLTGPDHRWLLPAAALAGGAVLVACDAAARTVLAPAELPVGIVTALLGAPAFALLLRRHLRRAGAV